MKTLIKLKDGNLTNMMSYISTNRMYDYYDDYDAPVEVMFFRFDNDTEAHFDEIQVDYADFCFIVNFFYGEVFTGMTIKEFCDSFAKYVHAEYKVTNCGTWK